MSQGSQKEAKGKAEGVAEETVYETGARLKKVGSSGELPPLQDEERI